VHGSRGVGSLPYLPFSQNPLEQAQTHATLARAINQLLHWYLRCAGINTSKHPVQNEQVCRGCRCSLLLRAVTNEYFRNELSSIPRK
jgi:hypothetical protein